MINLDLADQRGLSVETINKIKYLHEYRDRLEKARVSKELPRDSFLFMWTENEFALQEAWGFPEDENYHAFWNSPFCTCPKMDNKERLGTPYKIYSQDCPLHGWDKDGNL